MHQSWKLLLNFYAKCYYSESNKDSSDTEKPFFFATQWKLFSHLPVFYGINAYATKCFIIYIIIESSNAYYEFID